MWHKAGHLASAWCLLASYLSQGSLASAIPREERAVIDQSVEKTPRSLVARKDWLSPEYTLLYRTPLPIPPVKQPKKIITNPVTGKDVWYYELEIKEFQQQVYPNLRPAKLVGYDGMSPGPTFLVPIGTETVVRILNSAKEETSVHLHGSPSRAPFDGWAEDLTFPGEYKDYYWPNYQSARFLWYHDHAFMKTAENAYFGQAGAYLLQDPAEDALNLPSGYGEYDIPLVLSSKIYNADGTLQTTKGEDDSLWGDIIHVNGQPWPFMNVEPRKYRLRFLNAAVSRDWDLYFRTTTNSARIPFQVIGSDAGLLEEPATTSDLYIAPAERYEVVIDFSEYAGKSIDLRSVPQSNDVGKADEYERTTEVMRFVVSSTPVEDPSQVPSTLRQVPFPPATPGATKRHFRFEHTNSQWLINDVGFADVENRVLAKPPVGTVEIWELENSSGGWTHPIHVHLVDFRVVKRTGSRESVRNAVLPYESGGLKDVVWLGRGETVTIEAHYLPWTGTYMFHCHNLIHEDHDMMAVFNVTALTNMGYEEVTDFSDPMDARWRAVPFSRSDFVARTGPFSDNSVTEKVEQLAREEPYSQLDEALEALGA